MAKKLTKAQTLKSAQFEDNRKSIEGGVVTGLLTGAACFGVLFATARILPDQSHVSHAIQELVGTGLMIETVGVVCGVFVAPAMIVKARLDKAKAKIGENARSASLALAVLASPIGFAGSLGADVAYHIAHHPAPVAHVIKQVAKAATQG